MIRAQSELSPSSLHMMVEGESRTTTLQPTLSHHSRLESGFTSSRVLQAAPSTINRLVSTTTHHRVAPQPTTPIRVPAWQISDLSAFQDHISSTPLNFPSSSSDNHSGFPDSYLDFPVLPAADAAGEDWMMDDGVSYEGFSAFGVSSSDPDFALRASMAGQAQQFGTTTAAAMFDSGQQQSVPMPRLAPHSSLTGRRGGGVGSSSR